MTVSSAKSSPSYVLLAALTLLPLALLLVHIESYRIQTPIRDEWHFVNFLELMYSGKLRAWHLWVQDSEQRHVFSYSVMLVLARISDWNLAYEIYGSVVCASLVLICAMRRSFELNNRSKDYSLLLSWPLLSLIVFSLAQFETWLWGWYISAYINILTAVMAMFVLSARDIGYGRLLVAVLVGLMSHFSWSNGILVWPIGVVILLVRPESWRIRLKMTSLWMLAGAASICVFFIGYRFPAAHPPVLEAFKHPWKLVTFTLGYIGAPVFSSNITGAVICGWLGLVWLVGNTIYLCRVRRTPLSRFMFFPAMALYAIGSGLLTAIGRSQFGDPLWPRYVTTASLLLMANAALLGHTIFLPEVRQKLKSAHIAGVVTLLLVLGLNNAIGSYGFWWYSARYRDAEVELLNPSDEYQQRLLYPDLAELHRYTAILKKYRLGLFRGDQ